jgi:hypothetical protein
MFPPMLYEVDDENKDVAVSKVILVIKVLNSEEEGIN